MKKAELQTIERMVAQAVEKTVPPIIAATVNGKIDKLDTKFDEHIEQHKADMEELRPYIQAKGSLTFIFKSIVSMGSLAAAWLAIRSVIPHS